MKRHTLIAATGVTAGALIGAEWYLRRLDHARNRDRWFHRGYDGSHPYNVFHNLSGWELMPGYNVAGIRINQHGFRGEEFSRRKDPGQIRIMCLGDSCTFGVAGDESPYPYQLQQCLNEIGLEGTYQTINAGVEGHASINALLRLSRLLTFQPDVLIVYIGWNDMWTGNPKHYPDLRRKTRSYWHYGNGVQTPSLLVDTVIDLLGANAPPPPIGCFDLDAFVPTNFEFNIQQIIRVSKKRGIRVALVSLPTLIPQHTGQPPLRVLEKLHYPAFFEQGDLDSLKRLHGIYDSAIKRLAVEEDVDLIDLNAAFEEQDAERDLYFSDTWHPTLEGHQTIARTLAQGLYDREIVG
jgi:lysophospholipase L1-like esterase